MNYNKIINKFKKNSKGLSPVVASIILIAVTVAVSVVVAAWMGGMTIGLMGNAEQVSVTNAVFTTGTPNSIVLTVRNTGDDTVVINDAFVDGATATITDTSVPKGTPTEVTITTTIDFVDGAQYTIKLMTAKGTTVLFTATYSA